MTSTIGGIWSQTLFGFRIFHTWSFITCLNTWEVPEGGWSSNNLWNPARNAGPPPLLSHLPYLHNFHTIYTYLQTLLEKFIISIGLFVATIRNWLNGKLYHLLDLLGHQLSDAINIVAVIAFIAIVASQRCHCCHCSVPTLPSFSLWCSNVTIIAIVDCQRCARRWKMVHMLTTWCSITKNPFHQSLSLFHIDTTTISYLMPLVPPEPTVVFATSPSHHFTTWLLLDSPDFSWLLHQISSSTQRATLCNVVELILHEITARFSYNAVVICFHCSIVDCFTKFRRPSNACSSWRWKTVPLQLFLVQVLSPFRPTVSQHQCWTVEKQVYHCALGKCTLKWRGILMKIAEQKKPNMQNVVRIKNTLKTSQFYIIFQAQCWQNVSCYNTTGKQSKTTMMNTRICWYTALSINHLYLPRSEWRNHTIAIICSLPDREPPSIKTATQWLWLISFR